MANKFQVGQTVRNIKRFDGKESTADTDNNFGKSFIITSVEKGWIDSPDDKLIPPSKTISR